MDTQTESTPNWAVLTTDATGKPVVVAQEGQLLYVRETYKQVGWGERGGSGSTLGGIPTTDVYTGTVRVPLNQMSLNELQDAWLALPEGSPFREQIVRHVRTRWDERAWGVFTPGEHERSQFRQACFPWADLVRLCQERRTLRCLVNIDRAEWWPVSQAEDKYLADEIENNVLGMAAVAAEEWRRRYDLEDFLTSSWYRYGNKAWANLAHCRAWGVAYLPQAPG